MYKGSWWTLHRIKVIKKRSRKPDKHNNLVTAVQLSYYVNIYLFTINTDKTSFVLCFLATNLCDLFICYERFFFRTARWRLQSSGVTAENLWSFCPIFLSGKTPKHTHLHRVLLSEHTITVSFLALFSLHWIPRRNIIMFISFTLKPQTC